jgi:hypothetical protein
MSAPLPASGPLSSTAPCVAPACQTPPYPSFSVRATSCTSPVQVSPRLHALPLPPSGFTLLTISWQARWSHTVLFFLPTSPPSQSCGASIDPPLDSLAAPSYRTRLHQRCRTSAPTATSRTAACRGLCAGSWPVSRPRSSCRRCRPRPHVSSPLRTPPPHRRPTRMVMPHLPNLARHLRPSAAVLHLETSSPPVTGGPPLAAPSRGP